MKRHAAAILLAFCCFGQISAPRIGFVRDRVGSLRPVHGVSGAFVLGDAIADGVLSASSSGPYALAKTVDELLIITDGSVTVRRPATAGLASFGFAADGKPAWVRFESTGECLLWDDGALSPGICPEEQKEAWTEHDELVIARSRVRLRLPAPAVEIEGLGSGWLVLRTPGVLYAVHSESGREALFALPEAAQ